MISYDMTTRLLKDILPVGHSLNASTVRNHLCQVAQRLDAEAEAHSGFLSGCPRDWGNLLRPGKPLVVGIDGGYIRDRDDKKRNFEISPRCRAATSNAKTFVWTSVELMDLWPIRHCIDFS